MTVNIVGDRTGIYVNPVNCNAYIDIEQAINDDKIKLDGVNNATVYRYPDGKFFIAQIGGWTYDRGLFWETYDKDGNIIAKG